MAKKQVLVLDGNDNALWALRDMLHQEYDVILCSDGIHAAALLREQHFDVLVLDLMLPELDGFSLLEQSICTNGDVKILALTPIMSPYILETSRRLKVSYLIRTPCNVQALSCRIIDLDRCNSCASVRNFAEELLLELNLPPNLDGFSYLIDGIVLAAEEPTRMITKEIYPSLARKYHCSTKSIEHSIRSLLDNHWKQRDPAVWDLYFPGAKKRPTNSVFLFRMAQELKLHKGV